VFISGGWIVKRHNTNMVYHFEVIDDDFEEIIEIEYPTISGWEAVIRVYEKRGLNVAANLFRAIKAYSIKNSGGASINQVIDAIEGEETTSTPSFHKYREDLMKYLILV